MPVKRLKYEVEYADDDVTTPRIIPVRIILADRLATELHGRKYGLADLDQQEQLAFALWLFHAMIRQGDIPADTTFADFQNRVIADGPFEAVDVPPTSEFGGSVSGSPSTSLSSTGSTSSAPATTN